MLLSNLIPGRAPALLAEIEALIRRTTHGRIRDLAVEEVRGQVLIRGQVPSHHTKQLALHAALERLTGDEIRAEITVG